MKYIVVTGVSSGIGAEVARFLIEKGNFVFGSVRTEADAIKCQDRFGSNFVPLVFDVRNFEAITAAGSIVKRQLDGKNLSGLINNAGIAISGPLQYIKSQDIQDQFDINVVGLIYTTQVFLPMLGGEKGFKGVPGRVINISSVAGTLTMPFQVPYAASKHAVESINEGFRRELSPYGIKVISIRPGPIKSDIWLKELAKDVKYEGTIYESIWNQKNRLITQKEQDALPTVLVAKAVLVAIETQNPKLHYLVYKNRLPYYFARLLPARCLDRIMRKKLSKQINA